jgi:hypothetical protein
MKIARRRKNREKETPGLRCVAGKCGERPQYMCHDLTRPMKLGHRAVHKEIETDGRLMGARVAR